MKKLLLASLLLASNPVFAQSPAQEPDVEKKAIVQMLMDGMQREVALRAKVLELQDEIAKKAAPPVVK